ncbi:MAG: xanthine dehydrogenase family protein molybdopterin-binding subunit [Gammaproteobacteria bacterium]|nr:xanthine dehydrogenase family protein molybdopterin-binding subunit [Gammaproteobacteria bacterium]
MDKEFNIQRRNFLKTTSIYGSGLLLGIQLPGCGSSQNAQTQITNMLAGKSSEQKSIGSSFFPNAFLRITTDNQITIQVASSEMGQGVMTSLPMLLAEELEADWSKINVEFAPAHEDFENPRSARQTTGGSGSIRGFWFAMREAGAVAREMLLTSAAQTWNVDKSTCAVNKGIITHKQSNRSATYGQLVEKARHLSVPKTPKLKKQDQFRIIGQPIARLDSKLKVNGKAIFGQDVRLPNMLVATVVRCPVFEGALRQFDASDALKVKGVHDVFEIETGIAIVADHFWAAKRGRELLNIDWNEGKHSTLNSLLIRKQFIDTVNDGKIIKDRGDVTNSSNTTTNTIDATFETPYLAHTCMEPMNCTAHVQQDRCDIWVSTQGQGPTQKTGAKITGLSRGKVYVHTTFLGGGFGRRAEQDFVKDAVLISDKLKKPVKVIWTREDDIQHDFYRPATYNRLSAAIDKNGALVSWQHAIAGSSILHRIVPFAGLIFRGKDDTSTEGADNLPYDVANFKVTYAMVNPGIPVGFWRSVGNSQNAFVTECFIDEVATLAKKDPFEFRQNLLAKKPRHKNVLEVAAQNSGWGKPLTKNHFHGIAVIESFESFVAYVAEISITGEPGNKTVKVHRITAAVDCGTVVNPDTVVAQIQSGIVYGLTAALHGEITIKNGRVEQTNFGDYPALRMHEMPEINVHLVKNTQPPGGVGEIGVPPIAPAVANAVFASTGKRVRKLPIRLNELV